MKKRIVILISGRGSNMQAIVECARAEAWNAEVVAVISNRPQAEGLTWAAQQGLHTEHLDHRQFETREAFDEHLAAAIDRHAPDVVVLAGFMRILGTAFTRRYEGRMLNVHPSLLPAFPGLQTHRRALEAGCVVAGLTIHFVTAELDHGPIVAQAVVPVLPDDTEETLAQRVLAEEHRLYPQVVRWFVDGQLHIEGQRVSHRAGIAQAVMAHR